MAIFLFRIFDVDNDGLLSTKEIDTLLKTFPYALRMLSVDFKENISHHKNKLGVQLANIDHFSDWMVRNLDLALVVKNFEVIPSAYGEKEII